MFFGVQTYDVETEGHVKNRVLEDMVEGFYQNEKTAQIYTLGIC